MSCGELGPIEGGLIKDSTIQNSTITGSEFTGGDHLLPEAECEPPLLEEGLYLYKDVRRSAVRRP